MMYSSLYTILLPIIKARATGILSLSHKDGKTAEIFLSDGAVTGCKNGELSGEQAAKMVARWLNVDHEFCEADISSERTGTDFDEKGFIRLMNKIDLVVAQVNELVNHNETRLKMDISDDHGSISLKSSELKVVVLLNGKRTIDQVLFEAGVSEFDLVYTIYKYHGLGLIKKVGSHEIMQDAERASLLKSIDEKLSDLVGPAAMVITKEAFNAIGAEEAYLSWRDAGKLTDAIARHLDGEERQAFSDWWLAHPDRRRTLEY